MAVVIDIPQLGYNHDHYRAPDAVIETESNQDFLNEVLGRPRRLHYLSRDKWNVAKDLERWGNGHEYDRARYNAPTISLAVQAAHQCFAAHVPLELRPDTLWYMIVHQIAEHVSQNSTRYANLFTTTPGTRQQIKVRDDSLSYDGPSDWSRTIGLFRAPLIAAVGERPVDLFLPRFSTTTPEDEIAALVAFMDTVSPYYEFTVQTMCHIPQVRLAGTAEDWADLHRRAQALAGPFDLLSGYFADLLPVLQTIADTAAGATPDEEFWASLYKYNEMSGGEWVTGWINAFFAYTYHEDGPKLKETFDWAGKRNRSWGGGGVLTNEFPSHVSSVPFVWEYFSERIDMVFAAGILGVDHADGQFLSPRLGFAVAEK